MCIDSISNDLQVIANEKLMSSAKMVGRSVQLSLQKLMDKWDNLLDDLFVLNQIISGMSVSEILGAQASFGR